MTDATNTPKIPSDMQVLTKKRFFACLHADKRDIMPSTDDDSFTQWKTKAGYIWGLSMSIPGGKGTRERAYAVALEDDWLETNSPFDLQQVAKSSEVIKGRPMTEGSTADIDFSDTDTPMTTHKEAEKPKSRRLASAASYVLTGAVSAALLLMLFFGVGRAFFLVANQLISPTLNRQMNGEHHLLMSAWVGFVVVTLAVMLVYVLLQALRILVHSNSHTTSESGEQAQRFPRETNPKNSNTTHESNP